MSKVKEFGKGQPVNVETGGKPQPKTRTQEKAKVETKRDMAPTKDKTMEVIAVRQEMANEGR